MARPLASRSRDSAGRGVGLTLDLFHANIEEPDLPGAIATAGARLWHFQLAEGESVARLPQLGAAR